MSTGSDRMAYAGEVIRLLWPQPWTEARVADRRPDRCGTERRFLAFPNLRRTRVLIPADVPASARMLRRLGKGRTPWARLARNGLAQAVGSPAFRLVGWPALRVSTLEERPDSIEAYLATQLGTELRTGIMLGTPRANQKPVLQLFSPHGAVLGFAKVGHNELTADLVRREVSALSFLARHPSSDFGAPRLLHAGQWRSLEVCVVSALSGRSGMQVTKSQRVAAMASVAAIGGTTSARLATSRYWQRLKCRVAAVLDAGLRNRLTDSLLIIGSRGGEMEMTFGAWHGDWGHWNVALDGGVVRLWDWERFDLEVPIGFDALHFRAQSVRPADRARDEQERAFLDGAPHELQDLGVPAPLHPLTVALYLLEVSVRYAIDLNYPGGEPVRQRCEWSLGCLEGALTTGAAVTSSKGGR